MLIQVGDIQYELPKQPARELIDGYKLPKKQQKFIRTVPPENFSDLPQKKQVEFITTEIQRRIYGYWFYCNGTPTYLTGDHYFFLTYWFIDADNESGYPEYRSSDRSDFYFSDYCDKDNNCLGYMYLTNRRDGKALDITTPMPTPDGWRTMEELQVGDKVFGSDGRPTTVTFVSEIQYGKPCYDVTFSDKSKITACGEHKWMAFTKQARYSIARGYTTGVAKVTDTEEIRRTLRTNGKNPENNWSVENCKPIQYSEKKLLIPPYILGLWLGDGASRHTKLTSIDQQIIDEWEEYGKSVGLTMVKYDSEPQTYSLFNNEKKTHKGANELFRHLNHYDLIKNKHIPKDYLQSSVEDRIELLKGLMDTDGCNSNHSATFEYCSKSESLIRGVKELIESLGYKSTLTVKLNTKYNKSYFYIRFGGYSCEVFKLQRKRDGVSETRTGGWRTNHRYITAVTQTPSVPVKCLQVDNDDHTYLCGKEFIVTHNTEKAISKIYNITSRSANKHSGLQSLTGKDAQKNLFTDRLVRSWKKMFHEFKPLDDGKTDPKTAIRWFEPAKSSTKGDKKTYEKALESWIDWMPTKASAWQGKKMLRVLLDESATVEEMDVIDWWGTTKKTLMLGAKVIGKAFLPTTIENMKKKGGQAFMDLWGQSNINSKDANGRTQSGLYRYFKPAYECLEGFIDEFGNSMSVEARSYLQNERDGASVKDLPMLKRQYPFTVEEAFDVVFGQVWEPDVKDILQHVRNEIIREQPHVKYVKIFEVDNKIEFKVVKEQHGVPKIYEDPKPDVKYRGGFDGAASDKQTGADEGSMLAFIVLKGFAGMNDLNYSPVCSFSIRPERLEDAYLTVLLLCKYYGMYDNFQLLGESNAGQASPVVAFFANRGCLRFIMKKPRTLGFNYADKTEKYWIYRNSDVKDLQIILGNKFLRRYAQNIKILSVVDSLISIGIKNADEADAMLMAIMAFGDFDKVEKETARTQVKMIPVKKRDAQGRNIIVWQKVGGENYTR